jgi:DNA-binding XRE family transcriptional regulator
MKTTKNLEDVSIGRRIKKFRERYGYKCGPFANEIGISTTYLLSIENGWRHLPDRVLFLIAPALGLEPIDIKVPDRELEEDIA